MFDFKRSGGGWPIQADFHLLVENHHEMDVLFCVILRPMTLIPSNVSSKTLKCEFESIKITVLIENKLNFNMIYSFMAL